MDKIFVVYVLQACFADLMSKHMLSSKYRTPVHTLVKPSRTLVVSVAKMNMTMPQSVKSNMSEEFEAFHIIHGSVFATTVLPVLYFTISIFGLAGNTFILYIILKLTVSNTFTENQNMF